MPGQTKELDLKAPDAEALKIFYTTLHSQRPESEMAIKWLLQHGLLERDEAERQSKLLLKGKGKSIPAKHKASDKDFAELPKKKVQPAKGKKPAAKAKKPPPKDKHLDSSDEEEAFAPASKKPKTSGATKSKAATKPAAKPATKPAVKAAAKAKKDSPAPADSSDEDEAPLSSRTKAPAKGAKAASPADSSDEDDTPLSNRKKS